LSFFGYSDKRGFAAGEEALEAALDEIFSDPNLKALVIDVRINFGGADPYGLTIASRLATREYLAYTKEARADPADQNQWTPGDASVVRPSLRPGFRGPVVELIGPLTISAGETFYPGVDGSHPSCDPDRREHPGGVLGRPAQDHTQRGGVWPDQRGLSNTAGDYVRWSGDSARHRSARVRRC
jgi:hypothetical protein